MMHGAKNIQSSFFLVSISLTLFIVGSLIVAGPVWRTGRFFVSDVKSYVRSVQYQREYRQYTKTNYVPQARALQNKHIPVLLYHSVLLEDDGLNMTDATFKDHMFALKRAGYKTITARDLRDFLQGGKPLPKQPVLITFDDGAKNSFYPVDPLFRALGFKGTLFVITKYSTGSRSGGSFYLSEDELRYALGTGRWEILSHGRDAHEMDQPFIGGSNHFGTQRQFLDRAGRLETDQEFVSRITHDFSQSRADLERSLPIEAFGYTFPFGDFGQGNHVYPGTEHMVLDAVSRIYTMMFHQARWKYPEPFLYNNRAYMVPRIIVHADWTGDELLEAIENYKMGGSTPIPMAEGDAE